MKKIIILSILLISVIAVIAQKTDSVNVYNNSADNILLNNSKLVIGGYGEVHYNQELNNNIRNNGNLDVHRIVMLFGYNFSKKVQFVSELEFEHVKEVYVEQAFMQYTINDYIKVRAGLLLVPMGIINEYHEPTTFNGVERPLVDKYIAPTTWREIGFGIVGNVLPLNIKYKAYLINGFNGYDEDANINGKNGLRKARQKGAESYISSPNFTAKIEFYGIRGLNIGLSYYYGQTQSSLYDNIDKHDNNMIAMSDSSALGISMLGLDARYNFKGFQFRSQFYYTSLSNTDQYNLFTSNSGVLNDVGNSMIGYYAEISYDVLRATNSNLKLFPFVRYEYYDTHNSVLNIDENLAYENTIITSGLTLELTKGMVVKSDFQLYKNSDQTTYSKRINFGFGLMF